MGAAIALLAIQPGCWAMGSGSPTKPAGPAAGSEAAEVFRSLKESRTAAGRTPPGWIGVLEPIAQQGAEEIAKGGDLNVVGNDVANKASYRIMRNAYAWTFQTDSLSLKPWPARVLAPYSLAVAIGVALMQTTAPGRYAVVLVSPESGK
jgi:hypothetical protein